MIDTNEKFGVLFVDDEEKALKYFTRAFEKDFQVYSASSVADAKATLEEHADKIGVLISDQRMPGEKGVDLLDYARQNHPQITRILTTAYSDLDDAIEAVNSGEILRYITKPWDIQVLKTELRQAMQFFLLRRERDKLMQEKMHVWQRLHGLNRLRDLVVMASSFTATRNPLQAVQAFIEQTPAHGPSASDQHNFDAWSSLRKELEAMLALSRHLVEGAENRTDSGGFSPVEIAPLVGNAGKISDAADWTIEQSPPSILASARLIERLLESLLSWLQAQTGSGRIAASLRHDESGVRIDLKSKEGSWAGTTLATATAPLLESYFICQHHSGSLEIEEAPSGGLTISIALPLDPTKIPPSTPDLSWLEHILPRFENW